MRSSLEASKDPMTERKERKRLLECLEHTSEEKMRKVWPASLVFPVIVLKRPRPQQKGLREHSAA